MNGDNINQPQGSGFEALGQKARVDARMRRDDIPYTNDQAVALVGELQDFRINQRSQAHSKRLPWVQIANRIGIPASTLSEIVKGKYRGDRNKYLRLIDDFLADERLRAGRFDDRAFAAVGITQKVFGVIRAAIKHNSMAVIVGDSGDGKSAHARAFAADRECVALIRIDQAHGDQRGVSSLLYRALPLGGDKTHRERVAAIISHLSKMRNTVIVVDEAQKLRPDGLEIIRDIHDQSDPDGRRNVPVILFGDHDFYRLIVKARNGEPSPIKPQMTRRMYPILNLQTDGSADGQGGFLFTAEDVVRILRNNRIRVVDEDGVRWLASLANARGYGSIGFAMAVFRMAVDIARQTPITVDDLRRALQMVIGPKACEEIDHCAGGQLLRAVG